MTTQSLTQTMASRMVFQNNKDNNNDTATAEEQVRLNTKKYKDYKNIPIALPVKVHQIFATVADCNRRFKAALSKN